LKFTYNPPGILKKIFSDYYWNTSNGKILLTFDDGPILETTEIILQQLSKHKVKAMFFCVGDNIRKYPSLVKEMIGEGHTIGNHTYNHKILRTLTSEEKTHQIESLNKMMEDQFDYTVKFFRPPHGKFQITTDSLLKKLKLKNVMWSLLTYDYNNNIEVVKFAVKNYLSNNSIVVLHDSMKSKEIISDSINFIIEEAKRRNYTIGEPKECLN
jgi:peptidoglycan/xylan/chitin deacetylase (PgdA/CDA1 family)